MRVRPLTSHDAMAMRQLLLRDPITHCFAASRIVAANGQVDTDPWRIGGELLGCFADGELLSAVYAGANVIPIETTPATREAFIAHLSQGPRRCSSLVGSAVEVLHLWDGLAHRWGPAREVRADQPLMAITGPPVVGADPQVRIVRTEEIDLLLPASVAMFTEEVGISPMSGGMGSAYRARVADLIASKRAFARIEEGSVIFKAEVGACAIGVCQIQGVWVAPERRGEGVSIGGMAGAVALAQAAVAPCVSLYVNNFNTAARASYSRVGFDIVGTFATVLF
jgi:predicted GNAT family acetyltransferase